MPNSINIPPCSLYVSQIDFQKKVKLNTAKFRKLKWINFLTAIAQLVILAAVLSCFTYYVSEKMSKVEEAGAFSCVYQPSLDDSSSTITYRRTLDSKYLPGSESLLSNGIFRVITEGTYSVTFGYHVEKRTDVSLVSLVKNDEKILEIFSPAEGRAQGRSLYLALKAGDQIKLQCSNCSKIQNIHFCVAMIIKS